MQRGLPLLALAVGVLMLFGNEFLSGFALHIGDPIDPRFTGFLLEHSWLWLRGEVPGGLFDLPMGHPLARTLARAEPMLSFAPVYWPFRALGLSPGTSNQLWLVAIAALNFACFYAWMRRSLRLGRPAATAAAYLFAFGLPRVAQIGHSQLWPQMYVVLALWGLHALLRSDSSAALRRGGVAAVLVGLTLQAWGSVYNAVFLAYLCGLTGVFALLHPAWRPRARAALRDAWAVGCVGLIAALVCLWPLADAYLAVSASSQGWDAATTRALQPRPGSFVYVWRASWFYGWMASLTPLARMPALNEQALGLGLVTSGVLVHTLFRRRREPIVQLVAASLLVLVVPTIWWPGNFSVWEWVRPLFPGLGELRAVSRLGLFLAVPASVAVGMYLERRQLAGRPGVAVALVVLCLLEQGTRTPHHPAQLFDVRVDAIAEAVRPDAQAFFYVGAGDAPPWLHHVDAILAAQRSGIPTINMYTGRYPASWQPLYQNNAPNLSAEWRLESALAQWIRTQGLDPKRVQRIDEESLFDGASGSAAVP